MKALTVVPGGVAVLDQPDPRPAAGEVVVAVHSCGICGSDVHNVEHGLTAPGQIPGHEFAGTVVELGPGVDGWRTGQPVAVNPLGGCGACPACGHRLPFLCARVPNLGLSAPGGLAERVAVPMGQLSALPAGVDVELGAHAEPLAVALHAMALAPPPPSGPDDALVFGVGPIGLNVIVALRALGSAGGRIVAVGRSPGRRAAAAALGADVVLHADETNVADYAAGAGITFPRVFECSGASEAVALCAPATAIDGTIVQVGLPGGAAPVPARLFVNRNLHLVGSCAYGAHEYRQAVELLCSGALEVESLVSERLPLSAAPSAFERLRRPGHLVGVLVQPWR